MASRPVLVETVVFVFVLVCGTTCLLAADELVAPGAKIERLWVTPKGGVYFTDPRYGAQDGLEQDGFHVYYLPPDRKQLVRVLNNLVKPNGVVGTADGKLLYVADPGDGKTYVYRIQSDGPDRPQPLRPVARMHDARRERQPVPRPKVVHVFSQAARTHNHRGSRARQAYCSAARTDAPVHHRSKSLLDPRAFRAVARARKSSDGESFIIPLAAGNTAKMAQFVAQGAEGIPGIGPPCATSNRPRPTMCGAMGGSRQSTNMASCPGR